MKLPHVTRIAVLLLVCNLSNVSAQLRIVCIGNSITQGKIGIKPDGTHENSYRPWLWEKLTLQGFNIDMVGYHPFFFGETENNLTITFQNRTGKPFDRDSEAYYGIRSDGFLNGSKSSGWIGKPLPSFRERMNDAERGYIADVALIHIGTNDPDSTAALVAAIKANIISIIKVLRERNPQVQVFLANLITGWKKINPEIDGICSQLSTKVSPVISVDLTTGFINKPDLPGTMTYDYVHPNIAGQNFMMERWHKAIVDNLIDTKKPVLKGKIVVSELSSNSATIEWPRAVDNYGVSKYEIWEGKKLLGSVPFSSSTFKLSDIKAGVNHKIQVVARDFGNNLSAPLTVKIKTK